jgi:hypothetical protein
MVKAKIRDTVSCPLPVRCKEDSVIRCIRFFIDSLLIDMQL